MFWVLLALSVLVALGWFRASLRTATVALGLVLLCYGAFGQSIGGFFLALLIFTAVFVPLNVPALREEWLTRPALERFQRKLLPRLLPGGKLPAAEQGWTAQLLGTPDWRRLHALPVSIVSEDERAFLDGPGQQLAALSDAWRIRTRDHDLSAHAWAFLREQGFLGLGLPRASGGLGYSHTAAARVLHQLASGPGGIAAALAAGAHLDGAAQLLLSHGNEAQQGEWLPPMARGTLLATVSAEGPALATVARGLWKGRETLGLRLDFERSGVLLAPQAGLFLLRLPLSDPDQLLPQPATEAAWVLLPRDTPGLDASRHQRPAGLPFALGAVHGAEVFVPLDHWLAEAAEASADAGQALAWMAALAGVADALAARGGAERQLRLYEAGDALATTDLALGAAVAASYTLSAQQALLAGLLDAQQASSTDARWALQASASQASDAAAHYRAVFGTRASLPGPLGAVATQIETLSTAPALAGLHTPPLDLALLASLDSLRATVEAALDPNAGTALARFDLALSHMLGDWGARVTQAFVLAWTGGWAAKPPPDHPARRHYRQLLRWSAALGAVSQSALLLAHRRHTHWPAFERELAAALRALWQLSAQLRRFHAEGCRRVDAPLLDAAVTQSLQAVDSALDRALSELRPRWLSGLLRALVLPWRRERGASAAQLQQVAERLALGGVDRVRLLGETVPRADDAEAPTARLEAALIAAENPQRKLAQWRREGTLKAGPGLPSIIEAAGRGLISADEAAQLREAVNLAADFLRLDEFGRDELQERRRATEPLRES